MTDTYNQEKHEKYIRIAIQIANTAKSKGNHPFGALLVCNDEVILTAENSVSTLRNPTHHAELNLINKAFESLSSDVIVKCTLYTSCEPCPMCTGAIFWAGVRQVVYSLSALRLGEIAHDTFCPPCTTLFDRAGPEQKTTVIGPILPEEGEAIHLNFWDSL